MKKRATNGAGDNKENCVFAPAMRVMTNLSVRSVTSGKGVSVCACVCACVCMCVCKREDTETETERGTEHITSANFCGKSFLFPQIYVQVRLFQLQLHACCCVHVMYDTQLFLHIFDVNSFRVSPEMAKKPTRLISKQEGGIWS